MILLIDNYDSFSYNLVQLFGSMTPDISVIRNDAKSVEEILGMHPSHIILSPGPGYPKDAGICEELVRSLEGSIPVLGVCLGHQSICEVFGAMIIHAKTLMHGKQSRITLDPLCPLFKGLSPEIPAARYHSLIASQEDFPDCLHITASDSQGEIMAVQHKKYPIYGLQFHPESILTPDGIKILSNFLNINGSENYGGNQYDTTSNT